VRPVEADADVIAKLDQLIVGQECGSGDFATVDECALQRLENVHFIDSYNEALIAYVKSSPGNTVICVVNIDPHNTQAGAGVIPAHLGLPPAFAVNDLLSGDHYDWRIGANYVELAPGGAHVLRVEQ